MLSISHGKKLVHKVKELSVWVIRNTNTYLCYRSYMDMLNSIKITVCKAEITCSYSSLIDEFVTLFSGEFCRPQKSEV